MLDPSKDLLVSVVNAADPLRYQAMVEKLQAARSATYLAKSDIPNFSETITNKHKSNITTNLYNFTEAKKITISSANTTYKKFEALILQNFIDHMFTSETSHVFGKGQAGHIWRSMMSEAVGKEMAEAGGIGIAKMLEKQEKQRNEKQIDNTVDADANQNLYCNADIKVNNASSVQNLYSFKVKNV